MDFQQYIDKVENAKTKKTYNSIYENYLKSFGDSKGVIPTSKDAEIVEYIASLSRSGSTKKAIYSLLINISTDDKMKKKWRSYQEKLDKQKLKEQATRQKAKGEELPDKEELMAHMKQQYKIENWKSYIVNYLLIYYNVRNLDLVLNLVLNRKDVESGKNYIIVRKMDCVYVRGDYKTNAVYGDKAHIIKSKLFNDACKNLIADGVDTILQNGDDRDHLTREVQKHTLNGMNESDITKIMVSSIDISKNMDAIKRISERRGTTADMLLTTYKIR